MIKFKVPHTLALLLGIMILSQISTYLIPKGSFQTEMAHDHEVIVPGTFSVIEGEAPLPVYTFLTALPKAFSETQGIIFFLFIIGGALAVIRSTGAIDGLIGITLKKFGNRKQWLIFSVMFLFSIGSSTIGMAEEYLPFLTILIALCVALGLDALSAVAIMVVGYGIGYGVAAINPFTVIIAQEISGLKPTSGIAFRLLIFAPMFFIGWHHVKKYTEKVLSSPLKSHSKESGLVTGEELTKEQRLTLRHKIILLAAIGCISLIVYGVSEMSGWGWYLDEMSALFLALALFASIVGKLGIDGAAIEFTKGASELTGTALLVGFAKSIVVVLEQGQVLHTIIYALSIPLQYTGASLGAVGMFFFQSLLNFFIPSGSGQAFVSMPVMAPLADLSGISRQVAVLAYQFGDGFTNMVVPTNPVLMGILGIAGIPYAKWFKFILPLMIKLWIAGSVLLVIAVLIGYS